MTPRPSSLPMLAQCPCFESDSTEFAEEGRARHEYLAGLLHNHYIAQGYRIDEEFLAEKIDDESCEAVEWAADFIKMTIGTPQHSVDIEYKLSRFIDGFKDERSGTPDVTHGPEIFDFKWRERDYAAQLADYALMRIEQRGYKTVTCYILYGATRRVQKLIFDEESCRRIVEPVLSAFADPNKQPTPCDYCGWCANRLRCKALNERVQAVVDGREDWKLGQYHASQINEPAEALKALRIARQVKKWCEGVEFHAKKICDLLTQEELAVHGFKWRPVSGRAYCSDALTAYNLLGIPAEDFLRACDVRVNTSKNYPDKIGVADICKTSQGFKTKKAAKSYVLAKLEPVLKRGEDSRSLVVIGDEIYEN